jgi:hypothetical protein
VPCYSLNCEYFEVNKGYPPFTAEKQIELTRKLWELRPNIYPNFDLLVNHSYGEMIATFVNNRWLSLTEEEKQQVKGILE